MHPCEGSKLKSMSKVELQLKINNVRFVLVQVMLTNGGHFCGITLIGGKYLLYDGMFSGNKLRWISPTTKFESLGDYHVNSLWYRRCFGNEDALEQTEDHEQDYERPCKKQNTNSNPNSNITNIENSYDVFKSKASSTPTKQKKTKRYPMGVSIQQVKARGPQPSCQYCHDLIKRGEWHTVKRSKPEGKKWDTSVHYHFMHFRYLSFEEQRQLVTIVSRSEDVDDNIKQQLSHDIKNSLSRSGP